MNEYRNAFHPDAMLDKEGNINISGIANHLKEEHQWTPPPKVIYLDNRNYHEVETCQSS